MNGFRIISPDSSHWAGWVDAALGRHATRRQIGLDFHQRLLAAGRMPLLCWHHVEELLCIDDAEWARRRIDFIQGLPHIAFIRFPQDTQSLGSIVDILSAEAAATLEGSNDLETIRDSARRVMLHFGTGEDGLGQFTWVWEVVRQDCLRKRERAKLIAATRSMKLFDDQRTVGEIARGSIRNLEKQMVRKRHMRGEILDHIQTRGDREISDPASMTAAFMSPVESFEIPPQMEVRDLLVAALTEQGLDADEVRDDSVMADLNELALFRSRMKIVADNLGRPFEDLKALDMKILPSWRIQKALQRHGQDRQRSAGSDVVDGDLAALAPYVDELFVDKRTLEDFRRVRAQPDSIVDLIGGVRKAARFEQVAKAID
ncbi:hypothetical protein CVO77_17180 [Sphingopyxis lindanitolerans]|uniref:Uncharacterized protein n=1 Tax=Sphingopyxis lindanitolerans TaxID=2054227 RepID=A0A2S8B2U9_9SPHN|nr:hypothetical protein [Sphingopyxis lindanitolerans]PQM26735.1 hypothetical protein CVO77_17180 [Sphingopyxis lindanitolerans]